MSDEKTEKPTVEIAAPPAWAVEMAKANTIGFAEGRANLETFRTEVRADLEAVKNEGQRTNLRLTRQEVRMEEVETRLAFASQRAHAIVTEHTSQVDMEAQAREAAQIVRDLERDRQIAETRALAENGATKDDVKMLSDGTATKAEVASLVETHATAIGEKLVAQDKTLADQDGKLDDILKIAKATAAALGSKPLRYFLLICAAIGAMAGGAAAGWSAHEAKAVATSGTHP
jgi:hypothetical protein